jgi:hypothetical protein
MKLKFIRPGNSLLMAIVVYVGLFFVLSSISGLPGMYDPKILEYGKGPQLGEEYACYAWHPVPCSASEYWNQRVFGFPYVMLFIHSFGWMSVFAIVVIVVLFLIFEFFEARKNQKFSTPKTNSSHQCTTPEALSF